jgi:hypothetical protein
MLSGQEHPRFLSYPDWSDQQIYRSLEKRRMIPFDPVSQEQKHPAAHEERSAPNPFCEQEQDETGKDHGNADTVQELIPARSVFVIVLRHVVRQTQSAPPCGEQLPRMSNFITNPGKWLGQTLEIAAAFHGLEHGDFVGVFEVRADRDANADAGYADAQRLQQLGHVYSGGFSFGGGIGGDDNFFDGAAFEALDQCFYLELLGAAALQW